MNQILELIESVNKNQSLINSFYQQLFRFDVIIDFDQNPPNDNNSFQLPTLFKLTSDGNRIDFWQIGFDGFSEIISQYGKYGGKVKRSSAEVKLNSSNRNMIEQAIQMMRNKYNGKIDKGYVNPYDQNSEIKYVAMKGTSFVFNKNLIKSWPVAVQCKLDGVRAITHINRNGNLMILSYNNKPYNNITKHLQDELFDFYRFLGSDVMIDGELYSHEITFQKIVSIIKTEKQVHNDIDKIKYWIFDVNLSYAAPFEHRFVYLTERFTAFNEYRNSISNPINYIVILGINQANNEKEIYDCFKNCESNGYEGIMIKKLANEYYGQPDSKIFKESLYISGKRSNIFKYKEMVDREVTVSDVIEGEGDARGTGIFIVFDKRIEDPKYQYYRVVMKATREEKAEYLINKKQYIGLRLTIQYQELSENGVPRFPVGKSFRDYE